MQVLAAPVQSHLEYSVSLRKVGFSTRPFRYPLTVPCHICIEITAVLIRPWPQHAIE
jgi:hypothetical protein